MRKFAVAACAVTLIASSGFAGDLKPTVEIRTDYLMTIEAPLDPPQKVGTRLVVNVPAGGTVHGPKVNGTIIAPSGDWLYPMPDGSSRLDVRLTIQTDDNELIFMEYSGVMTLSKDASEKLAKQERLEHSDGYYIVAPRFSTASSKYAWLNQIQAVGKMVSLQRGHGIKYDVFEMR